MKLLTKTTLYIATLSLFLFFIMGIIFFQILKNMSLSELNRELYSVRDVVEEIFPHFLGGQLTGLPGIDSMAIEPGSNPVPVEGILGDTVMFDAGTDQYRTFRYLLFEAEHGGSAYTVKLYKSTTPADKLVEQVTLMMTVMVILFLAGIFFLNRFIFANLWKDFFEALDKLKQFDAVKEPVILGEPDVEEFMELKRVLERMTARLSSDYRELREYTDHTSHELQTPLAVIKTKTELLMQSSRLGPDEMKLLQSINNSAGQLSRLTTTLTLITRIENRQFTGRKAVNLKDLVTRQLEMFQEMIAIRKISLVQQYAGGQPTLIMDEGLSEIMVTNLLKNAIVHNVEGGRILIETGADYFLISNEGPPLSVDSDRLFDRFTRDTGKKGNLGLGLSLVRKICEYYGFKISYDRMDQLHSFRIRFG